MGDLALNVGPSIGDLALSPFPSVADGDFALWPSFSDDRGNLVKPLMADIVLLNPRAPPVVRSDESGIRSAGIPLFEQADTNREMFTFR